MSASPRPRSSPGEINVASRANDEPAMDTKYEGAHAPSARTLRTRVKYSLNRSNPKGWLGWDLLEYVLPMLLSRLSPC
jgi:hypothetical protein